MGKGQHNEAHPYKGQAKGKPNIQMKGFTNIGFYLIDNIILRLIIMAMLITNITCGTPSQFAWHCRCNIPIYQHNHYDNLPT